MDLRQVIDMRNRLVAQKYRMMKDNRVVLNVGGTKYEVSINTLKTVEDSLFSI